MEFIKARRNRLTVEHHQRLDADRVFAIGGGVVQDNRGSLGGGDVVASPVQRREPLMHRLSRLSGAVELVDGVEGVGAGRVPRATAAPALAQHAAVLPPNFVRREINADFVAHVLFEDDAASEAESGVIFERRLTAVFVGDSGRGREIDGVLASRALEAHQAH